MKIALNTRIYNVTRTGIQHYIEKLAGVLTSQYPNSEFVFFQDSKKRTLGTTYCIPTFYGQLGALFFDIFLVLILIVRERPNVYAGLAHVLPFVRVPGVKYILVVHDCAPVTYPQAYSIFFRAYFNATLWWSTKVAHQILAVSKSTKHDLIEHFGVPSEKIVVSYPGVDETEWIVPTERPTQDQYFFSVTTALRKNTEGVIAAFAKYCEASGDTTTRLRIAGTATGAMEYNFRVLADRLNIRDRVDFLGFISSKELIASYQHARAFIFPSFYEGFGFPVAEAAYAGTIPVTSRNSSLQEVLPFDDLLVDPYSIDSIAGRMKFVAGLSEDERRQKRDSIKQHVRQFDWKTTAHDFMELCQTND